MDFLHYAIKPFLSGNPFMIPFIHTRSIWLDFSSTLILYVSFCNKPLSQPDLASSTLSTLNPQTQEVRHLFDVFDQTQAPT